MRCSRSARAFIFAAELAPDQYLLVGIGNSPSVMAFLLLGHLVTFPRTHRARSPTVLTVALLCAPRLRGRVPWFCDTIPTRWRVSACPRGQARIIDHGRDGFQPHVAGARPARPFVVPLEEDRYHETGCHSCLERCRPLGPPLDLAIEARDGGWYCGTWADGSRCCSTSRPASGVTAGCTPAPLRHPAAVVNVDYLAARGLTRSGLREYKTKAKPQEISANHPRGGNGPECARASDMGS